MWHVGSKDMSFLCFEQTNRQCKSIFETICEIEVTIINTFVLILQQWLFVRFANRRTATAAFIWITGMTDQLRFYCFASHAN